MNTAVLTVNAGFGRVSFVSQFLHEWRVQWRRPFTWICALLYFGIAFGDIVQIGLGATGMEWVNGGAIILDRAIILSVLGVLAAAGIVGDSMGRDRDESIEPVVLTTGAGRAVLGGARFLVCFLVVMLTTTLFIPGMLLGTLVPGIPQDLIGPFDFSHYLQAFLLFILPNAFVMSALLYAVSVITRSQAAAFGAALGLVALYVGALMLLGRDTYQHDKLPLYGLLDPFGTIASAEFAMNWTVQQANTHFVPFEGLLQLNRLIWLSIGVFAALAATRWMSLECHDASRSNAGAGKLRRLTLFTKLRYNAGELMSLLMWELVQLWRSPVRTLSFVFAALTIWWVAGSAQSSHYSLPSTDLLIHNTNYYFDKIMVLVIAWLAGELMWRDQRHGVSALIDSQPVSAAKRLFAKTCALIFIVLCFWAISILVNVAYQLSHGVYDIELWLHLVDTFIVKAPYTIWLAVLAIVLQVVIRRRFVAMGVFGVIWTSSVLLDALGLYHPLYRFGEAPFFWYSNMDGYGHFMVPHLAFTVYWAVSCAMLWLIALAMYAPGELGRSRYSTLLDAMNNNRIRPLFGSALIVWLIVASVLYKATIVDHPWPLPDPNALMADAERELRDTWRERAQPRIVESRANIDLFPSTRSASIKGDYVLKNDSGQSIEQLLVMREPSLASFTASLPTLQGSEVIQRHPVLGYEIWQLARPLLPDEEIAFHYQAEIQPPAGFTAHAENDNVPQVHGAELVGNGSSFLSMHLLPMIGYSDHVEHKPLRKRRHYGHEDAWAPPAREFGLTQAHATNSAGWLRRIETTVSTDASQTPLSSGKLVEQYTENGRTTARYVIDGPARLWTQIVSGQLKQHGVQREGIPAVEVYYHPAHDRNIDYIADSFANALEYFKSRYGPAPYDTLRFTEQSLHYDAIGSRQGLSYATEVLAWKSDINASKGTDILKLAGHMVGLNWFGDQLVPANVAGAKVLHAGLPRWTGVMFMHQHMSDEDALSWRRQYMGELFRARMSMTDLDAPFDQEMKDSTMIQRKGSLLILALADLVGVERVEAAFAGFLAEWKHKGPTYPTVEHLIEHFYQQIPTQHHDFVDAIFRQIVSWQLAVNRVSCERQGDGWYVKATVNAEQLNYGSDGTAVAVASVAPITTALMSEQDGKVSFVELRKARLPAGESVMEWHVQQRPTSVHIDPKVLLPDANLNDNVRNVNCPI